MYLNSKNNLNSLTLGIACSLLVACGGGDTTTPSTISGTAADGYLKGAIVCLDTNDNGVCDAGEPTATTTDGGVYDIVVPAGTDTNKPLVVEVPSTAIDEDTGQQVGTAYVMKTPAGKHSFVSPITTMVQVELEDNPSLTVDDAENVVKASINMAEDDTSLFTDYVAIQNDNTQSDVDKALYIQLHKIARDIAQRIAENIQILNNAAEEKGVDTKAVAKELYALTMEAIKAKLSDISVSAESDQSTAAKDYDISKAKATITTTVDATDIQDKIADKKKELSKTQASWNELSKEVPVDLYIYSSTTEGNTTYLADYTNLLFSTTDLNSKDYSYSSFAATPAWVEGEGKGTANTYLVFFNNDKQKWATIPSRNAYGLTSQNNGRFVVQEKTSGNEFIFSVAKQNITDQKISRAWLNALQLLTNKGKADITFPKNSYKYTFDINNTKALLYFPVYQSYDTHNICKIIDATDITYTRLNNNCNAVYTATAPVKTLDALFNDATTAINSLEDINIKDFSFHIQKPSGSENDKIYYVLINGSGNTGEIDYYLEKTTSDGTKSLEEIDIVSKNKGQWERKSYGDKDIILLSHSDKYRHSISSKKTDTNEKVFYVVIDDFVRIGNYIPANINRKINYLNATAAKSVLAALGIPNPPEE